MSEEKVKDIKKEEMIDTTKMNLFTKIQNVRVELQKRNLSKSGKNKHSDYNYFELSDFMPAINELCLKYHVFTYEDINSNVARITAVDCDNPEITFTLTMDTAEVDTKIMNKVQGIGSQNTYFRRYLNMALFEISESDMIDSGVEQGEKSKSKKDNKPPVEDDKKTKMKALCTSLSASGHKQEVVDTLTKLANVKNPNSITDEGIMDQIIKELEALQ